MTPFEFVLLGLAAYRWTMLAVSDRLTAHPRKALADRARKHDGPIDKTDAQPWRTKLAYLSDCPFCFGVWAAAGVTLVYVHGPAWLWYAAVLVPAVAAVVSLLSLVLPED